MHDFCQFLSLASLALQVSRDCETNFKSRLARDARPLANPSLNCHILQFHQIIKTEPGAAGTLNEEATFDFLVFMFKLSHITISSNH